MIKKWGDTEVCDTVLFADFWFAFFFFFWWRKKMGWGWHFVDFFHVVFPPGRVLGQCLMWQDGVSMYFQEICIYV